MMEHLCRTHGVEHRKAGFSILLAREVWNLEGLGFLEGLGKPGEILRTTNLLDEFPELNWRAGRDCQQSEHRSNPFVRQRPAIRRLDHPVNIEKPLERPNLGCLGLKSGNLPAGRCRW